jgi:hypothetical protein
MKRPLLLVSALVLLPLAGCGGGADEPAADEGPLSGLQRMGEAAERMGEAAEEMERAQREGGTPAEPVDFRRLREMMPEEVAGLPRTNVEGAREGFSGMNVAHATARYEGPADADGRTPYVELKVTDLGGVAMAAMMGAAWTMAEVDRESDRDYERTTRLDGHPAFEKYDRQDRSGDFQVLVADRFLVQATGAGVADDQLRDAVRAVDLGRLEGMRDEGR